MLRRRAVLHLSKEAVPISLIKYAIKIASSAPSVANKQPGHFTIVKDRFVKKKIRSAAEKEEKLFYQNRAPDYWLDDLKKFRLEKSIQWYLAIFTKVDKFSIKIETEKKINGAIKYEIVSWTEIESDQLYNIDEVRYVKKIKDKNFSLRKLPTVNNGIFVMVTFT